MGKANIVSHIADGQYTAEILYDETQLQAQIDAITQALTDIASQITEAAASIVTLESQLAQQKETLRLRVLAWRTLLEEQAVLKGDIERLEEELEELQEELASLQEILQFLKDAGADQADIDLQQSRIDNKQDQIDAKTDELQQANTDLATNESEVSTIRTEIDGLYDTTAKTKSQLDMAKTKHGNLILRQAALDARLLALDANKPPEDIRDIWCADLTEDLTGEWPTLDIPGESELILLAPEEYVDEHNLHATTTSQFAPVIAMSPAQAAFNFAIHPGWQRHKPTYRVGVITAIDTTEDTASVTLDAANSRYQNLNVNEDTFLADIDVVYMSCNASAFEVDDRVVVEFPYQIPSEQHLQQTISNLAAAHSAALEFKTDLEARLAEVEADKTEAEADRDSLSAQLSDQMAADPVDMTAIEITLAQQVVNGALVTRLVQKKISTDQAISAVTAKIQRIQTAFDDATALAAVYPGPRVIGFEAEPQACYWQETWADGFCGQHKWYGEKRVLMVPNWHLPYPWGDRYELHLSTAFHECEVTDGGEIQYETINEIQYGKLVMQSSLNEADEPCPAGSPGYDLENCGTKYFQRFCEVRYSSNNCFCSAKPYAGKLSYKVSGAHGMAYMRVSTDNVVEVDGELEVDGRLHVQFYWSVRPGHIWYENQYSVPEIAEGETALNLTDYGFHEGRPIHNIQLHVFGYGQNIPEEYIPGTLTVEYIKFEGKYIPLEEPAP